MNFFHNLRSYFTLKSSKIKQLEKQINYKFINLAYLEKALTHRSVKNYHEGNYERLEFLGDAIIDHVVSLWLFKKYTQSNEGSLTKKRAALVNRNFLAMLGKKLKIIDLIIIDSSVEVNDNKVSDNISADVYEAIVGAIYLDGGYMNAAKFIQNTLCLSEKLADENTNYKGQLIEYCHGNNLPPPQFDIVESHGPEHNRTFTVKVCINDKEWNGIGSTKKSAEQDSAQRAIQSILRN